MSIVATRRLRLASQAAAAQSPAESGGPLAVRSIRVFPVREPVSRRAYTVLKLETHSGIAGYGESGSVSPAELDRAKRIVLGQPATAYERLRRDLAALPALEAAVNIALLDIAGKHAKAPVYQLLGGPTRNKARALASLEGDSNEALAVSLDRARRSGFRAMIVPAPKPASPNSGQAFVRAVRARLESLRKTAGDGFDFVVDGAASLSPGDAASLAAEFERARLLWFDEPCPLANLSAIRKISSETVTPLGFGRHVHHAAAFQELLREDAVDVLRPSLASNGISQIRRMAALAETYYVAVAPFHDGGPIGTAAALHLAASLPNFFIQQIPLPAADADRKMRAEIAGAAIESVANGFAALPTGPGLGIAVNERALERYAERAA